MGEEIVRIMGLEKASTISCPWGIVFPSKKKRGDEYSIVEQADQTDLSTLHNAQELRRLLKAI